jgi:hypothetical protein
LAYSKSPEILFWVGCRFSMTGYKRVTRAPAVRISSTWAPTTPCWAWKKAAPAGPLTRRQQVLFQAMTNITTLNGGIKKIVTACRTASTYQE